MMLVHRPPSFNPTQVVPHASHAHRRHPSAPPAVVVQPTKTPGLLSVSKPRSTPQRQLPSQQRRRDFSLKLPATGPAPGLKSQPLVARAPALLNPAEITYKKSAPPVFQTPASPSPQHRGRGKHGREKVQPKRTFSQSPVRSKHTRQPSPPVEAQMQPSLQAEAPIPSLNHFDPFLNNSDSQQSPPVSDSIPVPTFPARPVQQGISRSQPEASHMPPLRTFNFPICDESEVPTPPPTPLRKQAFKDRDSLVNAPISTKAARGFPFNYSSPPPFKGRRHRRSPSEGVFHMSSDEDISSSSGGDLLSQNLFAARNRSPSAKVPTTPTPSLSRASGAAFSQELDISPLGGPNTTGYFASSLFQNSPSPDELPDPLLF